MIVPSLILVLSPGMENVAYAVMGDDVARPTGVGFHSLAQAADERVKPGLFYQRVKKLDLENLASNGRPVTHLVCTAVEQHEQCVKLAA
jgi:hypothetical protein